MYCYTPHTVHSGITKDKDSFSYNDTRFFFIKYGKTMRSNLEKKSAICIYCVVDTEYLTTSTLFNDKFRLENDNNIDNNNVKFTNGDNNVKLV